MTPTMHLRFVERPTIVDHKSVEGISTIRTTKVLQQFWETPNGSDVIGDMFIQIYGVWKDIPLVKD